jgi:hypothetical protein
MLAVWGFLVHILSPYNNRYDNSTGINHSMVNITRKIGERKIETEETQLGCVSEIL